VLGALPGVVSADRHGDAVLLSCSDADTALRALLCAFPAARDIEVRGGSLEEAFLELTADDEMDSAATAGAMAQGGTR
jgi:ABC-2 type transport system ATP-binding protein